MVVVRGLARDERVLAGGQVDPFDHAKLRERVERPEDRRPAQAEVAPTRRDEEVVGGEVALATGDETSERAARRRQPIAGLLECADDIRGMDHFRECTRY